MELADTLTRAYLTEYERSAPEGEVEHIHATHFLPVPEHQLKELQKETACDQTLQTLNKALVDGFSDTKQELSEAIHLHFQLPYELSIHHIQGTPMCHTSDIKTKDQSETTRVTYWCARLPEKSVRNNLLARHERRNY